MTREEMLKIFDAMGSRTTEVDALLATACSRTLQAGALLNHMRSLLSQGREMDYWRTAQTLAEHLSVAGHSLTESHRILLGPAYPGLQKGELIH